jgi:hypothetical protein
LFCHLQLPLSHWKPQWLRLLWDAAPPLHLDSLHSDGPFIADGGIHLPAQPLWQQHCAAAAHAAAHLVYSPRSFEADGLVPTARALLALLEDARVEALAMRELPGLARLWRPLHLATPDSGNGCGLGLAIVKEIIERHGGEVALSNATPQGLHVRMWLPLDTSK